MKAFLLRSGLWLLVAMSLPGRLHGAEPAGGETVVEMRTLGGLRFDPPRFAVPPGARVKVILQNEDDMLHNFVLIAPGAREEVVNAAMALPNTPTSDFIPQTPKVLHHSGLLAPGKGDTVSFTAPTGEGIFPFACTYPGHGLIMYGAMYVTKKPLPPIGKDENLPPTVRMAESQLHAYPMEPPLVCRIFMRDCGPAAIAVALPGGQNYCWDAGTCRLRYAWQGEFIDPMPHWTGNGDGLAEAKGRIYYRAGEGFPLRVRGSDSLPAVRFLGYHLVERYPEFRYLVDGVEVRELIKPLHHGNGLESTFTVAPAPGPVSYISEPGEAQFFSPAGPWKDGVLTVGPKPGSTRFNVSLQAAPGREPLHYWSMNDSPTGKKWGALEPGVRGRAATFDGQKAQVATDLKTDVLASAGTLTLWVKGGEVKGKGKKPAGPPAEEQIIAGGLADGNEFLLGWNLAGHAGFSISAKSASSAISLISEEPVDHSWHHVAVTCGSGQTTLYVDGRQVATAAGTVPAGIPIFLGSAGGARFTALALDEVRLDDRTCSAAEVLALYQRDRPAAQPRSASPTP